MDSVQTIVVLIASVVIVTVACIQWQLCIISRRLSEIEGKARGTDYDMAKMGWMMNKADSYAMGADMDDEESDYS